MRLEEIRDILDQAEATGTIETIYFEGGEPFLYYPIMLRGIDEAVGRGFAAGVVSNGYWATSVEDALEWLRPLAGLIRDLSVSSDLYHWDERLSQQVRNAQEAAATLGIPSAVLSIAQPEDPDAPTATGQLPPGESAVMYQGRAAEKLAPRAPHYAGETFTECPHEDLREPGRVHVDPLGHVHLCHGISLGNMFRTPLREICEGYDPDAHPVIGPLLRGGPAELARHFGVRLEEGYADACHLCYETRRALRQDFPEILAPDQMYGRSGAQEGPGA
jgi:MoaA/NifB/PqqE/SkfB family radical SAM enzyme